MEDLGRPCRRSELVMRAGRRLLVIHSPQAKDVLIFPTGWDTPLSAILAETKNEVAMTAIARFEVIPVHEGSLSNEIAKAVDKLDEFDVVYETTATDTIVEAESADELFDAIKAAHGVIDGERVITSVEIDDQPEREQHLADRVAAIESSLGRTPRS